MSRRIASIAHKHQQLEEVTRYSPPQASYRVQPSDSLVLDFGQCDADDRDGAGNDGGKGGRENGNSL